MAINEALIAELEHESANTKKILQRVPEEHFGWKPHEKSYTLGRLASHIAELFGWIPFTLSTNELDFAKGDYKPFTALSSKELMDEFEKYIAMAREALQKATDDDLMQKWKLRSGEHIIIDLPKAVVLRSSVMNHLIHHRGQLTVYLRLVNVAVPGMYGPTADEPM